MSERIIKLNDTKDASRFVRAAEKCSYDVDLCYNSIVVDAKSILGVLGMDLTRKLTVRYHHEPDAEFDEALAEYAVS